MRSAIVFRSLALLFFVHSSSAKNFTVNELINFLPKCALQCSVKAYALTKCRIDDTQCLCSDERLADSVAACSTQACSGRDLLQAYKVNATLCQLPYRTKHQRLQATAWVCLIVTTFAIAVRLASRPLALAASNGRRGLSIASQLHRAYGMDDISCVLAYVLSAGLFVVAIVWAPQAGLGSDIWMLTPSQVTAMVRWTFATAIVYNTDMLLLKLSFLFLHRRVFRFGSVGKAFLNAAFAVQVVVFLSLTLVFIFQCTPVSAFWDTMDNPERRLGQGCISLHAIAWTNAVCNVSTDLLVLALPLFQVRKLKAPLSKKIAVSSMFAVGFIVTAVSFVRMHSLLFFANSTNPSWDNSDILVWSHIEVSVGIVCSCMPSGKIMVRELRRKYFPNYTLSSTQYSSRSGAALARSRAIITSDGMRDSGETAQSGEKTLVSRHSAETNRVPGAVELVEPRTTV